MSLDELLTAIEATSGDHRKCFTALMSAAAACLHNVITEMPDDLEQQMDGVDVGFRVFVLADGATG